jgi:RNA polymerase sigma factor (sigma-70 family)
VGRTVFCKTKATGGSKRVTAMSNDRTDTENPDRPLQQSFDEFYRDHYDAISRYVARRLPTHTHDEVVAATFVVAWRKYDAVSNPSLPWLYRIASYEVAHERRRVSRHPEAADLNDLELTDSHSVEEVIDISAAFSQLSDSDAEVLRLVHWEQLSRADAADVLGCSVGTLNVRRHRALDRLASTLHRLSNTSSQLNTAPHLPKENP